MLLLAQNKLEKGIALLEHYTDRLGLTLNKEKTRKINFKEEKKVEFLGFQFQRVTSWKNRDRMILVTPSPKSQKRCKGNIRKLINHSIPLKVKDQIENLNIFLAGWTGYYRLGHSSQALREISQYTNKRVRRLIQRHKGKSGYGWYKISSEYLYGNLGLFNDYKVLPL